MSMYVGIPPLHNNISWMEIASKSIKHDDVLSVFKAKFQRSSTRICGHTPVFPSYLVACHHKFIEQKGIFPKDIQ